MLAFDDSAGRQAVEEEEENYFVSMTDMMVGILFIFIIMLMVFALQFKQQTDETAEQKTKSEAQMEQILEKVRRVSSQLNDVRQQVSLQLEELSQSQRQRNRLLTDLRDELRAAGLDVQIDEENGVLRLTENAIRFASEQSNLDAEARENVRKLAEVLARVLPRYTTYVETNGALVPKDLAPGAAIDTVFLEGHTDITGQDAKNWQLSTSRAVETYRALTEYQPSLRSLRNREESEIISVSGYSSTRPISDATVGGDDKKNRSQVLERNRRIDMRFVMQVDPSDKLNEVLKLTDSMQSQINELREAATVR